MTWQHLRSLILPGLILAAACDRDFPTGVDTRGVADAPGLEIADAAHGALQPGFYFLPPLSADPTYAGAFDPALAPTAVVCSLVEATPPASGFVCGATIKTFTGAKGAEAVTVDLTEESYNAVWITKKSTTTLLTGKDKYRVEVYVGTVRLGYADLWFVASNKDLKQIESGYVGLVVGSPLQIKFRIEAGIVGQVLVTPATAIVSVGGSQQFTAVLRDLHGDDLVGPPVTWSSSNASVATVNASGEATGVSAGTATIIATSQRVSENATLTVESAGQWTVVDHGLGTTGSFYGIWGSSASDVYAMGYGGVIAHFDGTAWSALTSGYGSTLEGVWGRSGSDVFAVGLGAIKHYDGTSWSDTPAPSDVGKLWSVWGSSGSDVFAVGDLMSGYAVVAHYNGTSWSTVAPGTALSLRGVWGSSATDVYAVGHYTGSVRGIVMRYDGTSWSSVWLSGLYNTGLNDVWGSAANDVFAVGDKGTIMHYDGTSWTSMTSPSTADLQAVWGSSGSDVYAVGFTWSPTIAGVALHFNGTSWSTVTIPSTGTLYDIWGSSASDIYVLGGGKTILHYGM